MRRADLRDAGQSWTAGESGKVSSERILDLVGDCEPAAVSVHLVIGAVRRDIMIGHSVLACSFRDRVSVTRRRGANQCLPTTYFGWERPQRLPLSFQNVRRHGDKGPCALHPAVRQSRNRQV